MKIFLLLPLVLLVPLSPCLAQIGGNIAYSQPYGKLRPDQNERDKRQLSQYDLPPGTNSMFLDASVLMNVPADEFVAVFAVSQEGATPADCNQRMAAVLQQFISSLRALKIGDHDVFVDYIAQEKVYDYRLEGDVAREELAGFELKKNVSIHYRDKALIDSLVSAAADQKIFDLVKVDYIVKDAGPIQSRLMTEAAGVIQRKTAEYNKLFGIVLSSPPQVYVNKPSVYYPSEMYDGYTAFESEQVNPPRNGTIQNLRKTHTFYFNPLNANGFDTVINPVVVEPVVQYTLYLKLKYDLDATKSKTPPKADSGN